jgi:hypothetical protein
VTSLCIKHAVWPLMKEVEACGQPIRHEQASCHGYIMPGQHGMPALRAWLRTFVSSAAADDVLDSSHEVVT